MNSVDLIFQQTTLPAEIADHDINALTQQFQVPRVTDWTIPQAFMCVLLCAAMADGNLAREELSEIQALSVRSRIFKQLSPADLAAINADISKRLKERPRGLQEACEAFPQDLRLSVFGHCVEIVLADGEFLQVEMEYLSRISNFMEIPSEDAQFVMKALLVKNRI